LTKKQEETEMKKQNKKQETSWAKLGALGNRTERIKMFNELFPNAESTVTAKSKAEFNTLLQLAKCGNTAKWLGSYAEGKVKSLTLKKVVGKEKERKAEVVKSVGQLDKTVKSVGCFGESGQARYC
jgi:hypothetical protein